MHAAKNEFSVYEWTLLASFLEGKVQVTGEGQEEHSDVSVSDAT